jgi:ATP-dependent RNA helicase DeaD
MENTENVQNVQPETILETTTETTEVTIGRKPVTTDDDDIEILDVVEEVNENIFESWGISKETLKSLAELKFTSPTPIQKQAIPLLLKREKDFVGLAATGTGKTGAFGIPLVESISAESKTVQALVMCPTRELATQVEAQIQKMAKWKGLSTLTVFGGSSYDRQITALKRGVHIVVGTPGRLVDLIDRKVLKLNDVQTLVLDEADEMISMGFQDDLEKILEAIGEDESKRKWLFSATMSPEIRRVVSRYLPEYDKVEIHKEDSQKPQIEQVYYTIYPDRKLQMLSAVLYMNPEFYGLVFCQTKREVTEITDWLKRKNFKVDCIHGDRPQRERDFILKDFRTGRVKILVATDVAARGLDINDLTHVINFSLPREVESYVHRIGRTGRAGKKGLALSIVAPHEVKLLKRIQQVTKATITKGTAPSNDELNVYRVKDVINGMNQVKGDEVYNRASKFLDRNMDQLRELFEFEFSAEEFLKRLLVSEHPDIFENRDTSMDFVGDGVVPREMQEGGGRRDGGRSFGGDRGDRGGRGGYGRRERSFGDRGERGGERGGRSYGDRSERSYTDRSERSFGDRSERSEGGRSFDRGERSEGRSFGGGERRERSSEGRSYERGPRREGGYSDRSDRGFGFGRETSGDESRVETRRAQNATATRGFKSWNADDAGDSRPRQRTRSAGAGSDRKKSDSSKSSKNW